MENTNRDRTEERRDRDNPGDTTAPPIKRPDADASGHVPGSATEMAELNRRLQDDTVVDRDQPAKGS